MCRVGADRDRAFVGVEVGDGADGPVADPDTAVVPYAQDAVAGLEGEVVDVEGRSGDGAVAGEVSAGALVEVVDVVVTFGEHEDVVAGEGGGVPVGGHVVADVDRGVGDDDAVVGVVAVERVGDPAGAEVGEGVAFPGVLLAAVLGEGDGREPVGEPVEETAGVDRVELAGIADHDDFRACVVCGVEEGDEAAGGCHRGFVDHDHGLSVEAAGFRWRVGGCGARWCRSGIPVWVWSCAAAVAASAAPMTW